MALLVLVVLSLAAFLRVESMGASARQASLMARLNAMAAVRLAQSAVQQSLGPDTRISAPASLHDIPTSSSATTPGSDPYEYPVMGVWRSWEGLDHDIRPGSRYAGRPQRSDYSIKWRRHDPANPKQGRFLGWLISSGWGYGNITLAADEPGRPPRPVAVNAAGGAVPLVGPGSVTTALQQVHLVPLSLADGRPVATSGTAPLSADLSQGAFAWWVGGENQKVLATFPPALASSTSTLELSRRLGTFGRPDLESVGYVAPDPAHESTALPSRRTVDRYIPAAPPARLSGLLAGATPPLTRAGFHDVAPVADGLLTNSATGGLRKDLSLLTEMWDKLAADDPSRAARLPLFRNKPAGRRLAAAPEPDHDLLFTRPLPDSRFPGDVGNRNRRNLMYWWADYGTNNGTWAVASDGGTKFGGISSYPPIRSWAYLADYALHYRRYVAAGTPADRGGEVTMDAPRPVNAAEGGASYTYYERVHRHPLVARIEFVFAAAAVGNNPAVLVQPIVTLWNPYNVRLSTPAFVAKPRWRDLPIAFEISASDATGTVWGAPLTRHARTWGWASWDMTIPAVSLAPGQTRVFSHGVGTSFSDLQKLYPGQGPHAGNLVPGYTASPLSGTLMVDSGITAPAGSSLRFRMTKRIDWPDLEVARNGIYVDLDIPNYTAFAPCARYSFFGVAQSDFLLLYGTDGPAPFDIPLATAQSTARAFGMFSFGIRLSNDGIAQYTARTGIKTISKGFMQSTPFASYTELGMKSATELTPHRWVSEPTQDASEATRDAAVTQLAKKPVAPIVEPISRSTGARVPQYFSSSNSAYTYSGSLNLLNAPFDFYTYALTDFSGTGVPQCDPFTGEGFVLTGLDAATGLGKAVVAGLPVRPLQSLAELQSCDIRATNPAPPFGYYLIGNSDASPVLPPDDPVGRFIPQDYLSTATMMHRDANPANHLQYDDSYCLNHVLFDDWFVSSLAPPPSRWNPPSVGAEFTWDASVLADLQSTWEEVRTGAARLPNAAYAPLASAAGFAIDTTTVSLAGTDPALSPHFLRLAAHLKVEGQFNVNSLSVAAWRAVLGHLRGQRVPVLEPGATSAGSVAADNPLPRFQVSPQVAASAASTSRAVTGFAALTDTQLDRLAEEIVRQVRLRGPFLSLSEFVNRRLSEADGTDTDPTLGGALAMALRRLEAASATHPAPGALARGKPATRFEDLTPSLLPPTQFRNFALGEWIEPAGRYAHPRAAQGSSNFGMPAWPRQADLLQGLAPVVAVRDDTVVVRACGTASGVTAWCEVTLVRAPDYVDARVASHESPFGDGVVSGTVGLANGVMGRRYRVASFRWLRPDEI